MQRSSGILMHPTSFPGRHGIGTLNRSAYAFVDFLESAGQSVWQVLPLGPTSYGDSPYQSLSTFAGNPYLISLDALVEDGLLSQAELVRAPAFGPEKVDYCGVYEWKLPLLRRVAEHHAPGRHREFAEFCEEQRAWLDNYALFVALKQAFEQKAWNQWDMPLRRREGDAIDSWKEKLAGPILVEKYLQWLFSRQWRQLKAYANQRGIQIFGDIPIFVAMDSADAWVHADIFHFDKNLQPKVVAGVPPDYFATTGQLWGNPLYNWKVLKEHGYAWWVDRVAHSFRMYDLLRIDHFRGFAGYWEVKADAKTAEHGRWVKGPGADLFKVLQEKLGDLAIIAEDLGDITPDVEALRDGLKLPGMKIIQFGFGSGAANPFLVHNYKENFVVYTGTHDNDTVRGWFEASGNPQEREHFQRYFNEPNEPASQTMIRAAMQSVAVLAVTPIQDLLDLGGEARMNFPGRSFDNWQWRLQPDQLTQKHRDKLLEWTRLYGRVVSS